MGTNDANIHSTGTSWNKAETVRSGTNIIVTDRAVASDILDIILRDWKGTYLVIEILYQLIRMYRGMKVKKCSSQNQVTLK
jgi:hypothetical protein